MTVPSLPDARQPIILVGTKGLISREWFRFLAALKDYAIAPLGQMPGTNTGDDAGAGAVGELVKAAVAAGSAVALSTGVTANVASINLTPGDWDVWGVVDYTFAATTSYTQLQQGISIVSATMGARDTFSLHATASQTPNPASDPAHVTPAVRIVRSTTTTVYLVSNALFATNTLKAYGSIFARRRR